MKCSKKKYLKIQLQKAHIPRMPYQKIPYRQHHYTLVLNTEKTSAVLLPKTKMTSHSNLSALQHTTAPYTEMKVAV